MRLILEFIEKVLWKKYHKSFSLFYAVCSKTISQEVVIL